MARSVSSEPGNHRAWDPSQGLRPARRPPQYGAKKLTLNRLYDRRDLGDLPTAGIIGL